MTGIDQSLFAGEFRHNLDSKRRLTVPSKWRSDSEEPQTFLAIPDKVAGCVMIYPPRMVEKLQERIAAVGMADRKGRRAITRLMGQSDSFAFDKNGRVVIKDSLFDHAGIEKEVVLVGAGNYFELWAPERYEAYVDAADDEDGDMVDTLAALGF